MHYSTDPLISKNAVKAHSYHFLLKAFSALVPIDSVPRLTCALCRPPSWFLLSHCVRNNLPTSPPRLPANVFLVTRCWINWIMPFSFYSSKTERLPVATMLPKPKVSLSVSYYTSQQALNTTDHSLFSPGFLTAILLAAFLICCLLGRPLLLYQHSQCWWASVWSWAPFSIHIFPR